MRCIDATSRGVPRALPVRGLSSRHHCWVSECPAAVARRGPLVGSGHPQIEAADHTLRSRRQITMPHARYGPDDARAAPWRDARAHVEPAFETRPPHHPPDNARAAPRWRHDKDRAPQHGPAVRDDAWRAPPSPVRLPGPPHGAPLPGSVQRQHAECGRCDECDGRIARHARPQRGNKDRGRGEKHGKPMPGSRVEVGACHHDGRRSPSERGGAWKEMPHTIAMST